MINLAGMTIAALGRMNRDDCSDMMVTSKFWETLVVEDVVFPETLVLLL
jgi:hypothetical protein